MTCYLSPHCVLKWLETPSVYDLFADELYELDREAFSFLQACAAPGGGDGSAVDKAFLDYCIGEGIIGAVPCRRERPPVRPSPAPSLRYLELQITDRCNLQCGHCYIGRSGDRELPLDALTRVLDEFETVQGLRLLITGGEPLLHRRFDDINRLLPRYAFRKVLFTNGLLLDRARMRDLAVEEVQFSVDGMEQGHDALRGQGAYRKVMRAVEETLAEGLSVSVATMVHRGNLHEFDAMEARFTALGIKDWTVDAPCAAGSLKEHSLVQVSPREAGRYLNYGFGAGLHGGGEGFACGLHLLSVLADGRIAKCAFYADAPLGTLAEGLQECWSRLVPVKLADLECAALSCAVIEQCRGGCRYRAAVTGSEDSYAGTGERPDALSMRRDLYRCHAYDII